MIAASVRSSEGSTSTAVEIRRRISPWTARSDCSAAWRARGRQEGRRPHGRDHQVRHGPEGGQVQAPGAGRPPMVERDVRPRRGEPLVHDRHDDRRLEAEGVELGRPGERPRRARVGCRRAPAAPGSAVRQAAATASPDRRRAARSARSQPARCPGRTPRRRPSRAGPRAGWRAGARRGRRPGRDPGAARGRASVPISGASAPPGPSDALPPAGERPLRGLLELARRERLHQVVHRAEPHGPLDGIERRVGRDHHDLHRRDRPS